MGLLKSRTLHTFKEFFIFNVFSVIAFVVFVVFGSVELLGYANYTVVAAEFISAGLTVLNFILLRVGLNRPNLAANILIFNILLVVDFLVIDGGIERTGIFWFLTFPALGFFLTNRRTGIAWAVAAIISIIGLFAGQQAGYLRLAYSYIELRQMISVFIVISLLVYLYERRNASYQSALVARANELAEIISNMPIGVAVADGAGNITMLNSAARTATGWTTAKERESTGVENNLSAVVKEDGTPYPSEEFPLAISLKTGQRSEKSDIFIKSADGAKINLRSIASPIRDDSDKILSAILIFEDITAERELDRAKTEFASLASHQLQSPLGSIKWIIESFMEMTKGKLSPEEDELIRLIYQRNDDLLAVARDLLDVSRIETSQRFVVLQGRVNAAAIAKNAVEKMRIEADKKKIALKLTQQFPGDIYIKADDVKLGQLFQILLDNAIRYSPDGGQVEIYAKEENENVIFAVKDGGYGIPKKDQKNIFQKFFRAENVARKLPGTGLGLYIAKAIVESHGGKIWFESAEDRGTTFYALFPKSI